MAKMWDISVTKRKKNKNYEKDIDQFALEDYLLMAQKFIKKYTLRNLGDNMLRDEDAISFVAEHLIYATQRWDKNRGASLNTYLIYCFKCCIPKWVKITQRDNYCLSLDFDSENTDNKSAYTNSTYVDIFDDKQLSPIEFLIKKEKREELDKVIKNILTPIQQSYVNYVYKDGLSISETSRIFGVSRQAVSNSLINSSNKIRQHYQNCEK